MQSYVRDIGGGNVQLLKEVDELIVLGGQLWGNVRIGYRAGDRRAP